MSASRQSWGFTLIELLVVLAIIGILTTLVTINIASARATVRDNQRRADLASLATSLELYRSQQKVYPTPSDALVGLTDINALTPSLVPSYLTSLPKDPKFVQPYSFATGGYLYATNGATVGSAPRAPGSLFVLDTLLERREVSQQLDPNLAKAATDNTNQNFFLSGFYQYPDASGPIRYRLASQ